jgi:hypothetical protein
MLNLLLGPIFNLLGEGVKGVSDHFEGKRKLKAAKLEAEMAVYVAQANADIDWNAHWARQAATSWKDEYVLILLSFPLILSFIPPMVPHVEAGFLVLNGLPEWYKYGLGAAFAASFGMKSLTGMFGKK